MGEVYRALDTRLGRTVAIKVLSPNLSREGRLRARFQREGRVISGLSHPHICALFDIGEENGVDYLVLEYIVTAFSRLQCRIASTGSIWVSRPDSAICPSLSSRPGSRM